MEPRTAKSQQNSGEILTVPEVAAYLRVTTKTVYSLIRDQSLRSFRVGRHLRCHRTELENFVARSAGQTQPTRRGAKRRVK
ncbi:MAG: helix-turn-helix domain-containing protein [Myxococcales bacterium]|nr:helix-turn-helix domain-containing protein [Myxococcales bacterium]